MPSTTSSTVSADFDSSTVMTPSLPTFSIASAIRLPIVLSLLEAIVATWAISFLSLVDLLSFFSSSLTASTAASMPRLRPIGLAPAVTLRRPSRKMAWASTVAVVVPSPAMSEVLEATSFSIWAPMSSYETFSSNFLSMTTLRPFGPSVAFTACARMFTPLSRAARASSSNLSCFGMDAFPPGDVVSWLLEDGEDVFLAQDQVVLAVDLDLVAGVLAEQDAVALLDVERNALPVIVDLTRADRLDGGALGLFLCRVRDDDPADLLLALFLAPDQHPIVQRTNLLRHRAPASLSCGGH